MDFIKLNSQSCNFIKIKQIFLLLFVQFLFKKKTQTLTFYFAFILPKRKYKIWLFTLHQKSLSHPWLRCSKSVRPGWRTFFCSCLGFSKGLSQHLRHLVCTLRRVVWGWFCGRRFCRSWNRTRILGGVPGFSWPCFWPSGRNGEPAGVCKTPSSFGSGGPDWKGAPRLEEGVGSLFSRGVSECTGNWGSFDPDPAVLKIWPRLNGVLVFFEVGEGCRWMLQNNIELKIGYVLVLHFRSFNLFKQFVLSTFVEFPF